VDLSTVLLGVLLYAALAETRAQIPLQFGLHVPGNQPFVFALALSAEIVLQSTYFLDVFLFFFDVLFPPQQSHSSNICIIVHFGSASAVIPQNIFDLFVIFYFVNIFANQTRFQR